ncbi:MAG: hypothetical protein NVS2B16_07540 [Chloroflexota bacterium]
MVSAPVCSRFNESFDSGVCGPFTSFLAPHKAKPDPFGSGSPVAERGPGGQLEAARHRLPYDYRTTLVKGV